MCVPILLQNWLTVRGNLSTTVIKQEQAFHADLLEYRDIAIYVDISDFSGAPRLDIQTSPTHDEAFFLSLSTYIPVAPGLKPVSRALWAEGDLLTRWARWRAYTLGGSAFSITFRVWLSGVPFVAEPVAHRAADESFRREYLSSRRVPPPPRGGPERPTAARVTPLATSIARHRPR